jgi:hypothetical protein
MTQDGQEKNYRILVVDDAYKIYRLLKICCKKAVREAVSIFPSPYPEGVICFHI